MMQVCAGAPGGLAAKAQLWNINVINHPHPADPPQAAEEGDPAARRATPHQSPRLNPLDLAQLLPALTTMVFAGWDPNPLHPGIHGLPAKGVGLEHEVSEWLVHSSLSQERGAIHATRLQQRLRIRGLMRYKSGG